MNLDDLMAVWKSQDAAPLHGVNETLLRLALRQDEANTQKQRRRERWITYGATALTVALLARFFFIMITRNVGYVLSGWDYALPAAGVVAVLFWARRMYVRQRTQSVREQRFGDSLRDQINRQLAQCDYLATRLRAASRPGIWLRTGISATVIILASWRINHGAFSDARLWGPIVFTTCWIIVTLGGGFWVGRRFVQQRILPRKSQLEALLKELDGQ